MVSGNHKIGRNIAVDTCAEDAFRVRLAMRALNLAAEIDGASRKFAEGNLSISDLIWRFRTDFHSRFAAILQEADLVLGPNHRFIPSSVQILEVRRAGDVVEKIYGITETSEANIIPTISGIGKALNSMAQHLIPLF
jgi:hypothetical protein